MHKSKYDFVSLEETLSVQLCSIRPSSRSWKWVLGYYVKILFGQSSKLFETTTTSTTSRLIEMSKPFKAFDKWPSFEKLKCKNVSFLFNNTLFFKWANPGLFFVYFRSFQTNIKTILQQINVKNVKSIQYTAPGFKPTTSWTWIISHNHSTRAPCLILCFQVTNATTMAILNVHSLWWWWCNGLFLTMKPQVRNQDLMS